MYQNDWMPVLGEVLHCSCEMSNVHDPFAIKVTKDGSIVGYLPKKMLNLFSVYRKGRIIYCDVTDLHRRYSWDLVQGGLKIPCVITLQSTTDLIDKASKLLAISDMEIVIPAAKMVTASLPAGETKSNLSLVIPAEKKIKVEPLEVTVEVEQNVKVEEDQDVWATIHNTRIQLFVEDKLMIENDLKLNDKHVNFA